MKTGLFFYYQQGERLRDFPEALQGILERENVFLYDAYYPSKPPSSFDLEPISAEVLCQIHSPEMVDRVRKTGSFEGALFSATGTVRAAEAVCRGEIDHAFVFTGYGDHHAGTDFFGGGCYFNGAAIAIQEVRKRFGVGRFAIVDTDAHHGEGTWEIFQSDPDVLYICFCDHPFREENNNVNIQVPVRIGDEDYLRLIEKEVSPRVKDFKPDVIFWNWGYDGTKREYGDIGLTAEVHILLGNMFKKTANEICRGKLIIVLCGGSSRDLATYLIPKIIRVLVAE